MARMKKFLLYLVLFILLYCTVNILTYLSMKNTYKDLKCEKENDTAFTINIEEAKTAYSNGYVNGSVTNNSGKLIDLNYVKLDLYKNNIYIGTKYKEIKYFNVGETTKFSVDYKYTKIDSAKISIADELPEGYDENDDSTFGIKLNMTDEQKQIAIPIAVLLGIWYILP